MNIIDVYAVYGDFGNFGSGNLIGIFDSIKQAEKVAKGRGSLDCGGDGKVVERRAIQDGKDFYLLELNFPILMNKDINPDPRCESGSYSIIVTKINNSLEFMKLFRKKTCLSLLETKRFMDTFHQYGKAQIPNPPFDNTHLKEDAILWKQEAELNDIAKLEFKKQIR